jgi:predicted flap endonuclease-1-like 5' DNA nuclease
LCIYSFNLFTNRRYKIARIIDVEGIGPKYAEKLEKAGISSTDSLLKMGASPAGRKDIATKTGISDTLILEWVNHVDLYRIKGVGSEYSDLLEEAGVDTVVELAQRKAANLFAKLIEVNTAKKLVRKLPTQNQVEDWIAQAKKLPRVIKY